MRKLSLKKESLTELTVADLTSVVGAATFKTACNGTAITCDGPCHSDFQECITGLRCASIGGC